MKYLPLNQKRNQPLDKSLIQTEAFGLSKARISDSTIGWAEVRSPSIENDDETTIMGFEKYDKAI